MVDTPKIRSARTVMPKNVTALIWKVSVTGEAMAMMTARRRRLLSTAQVLGGPVRADMGDV